MKKRWKWLLWLTVVIVVVFITFLLEKHNFSFPQIGNWKLGLVFGWKEWLMLGMILSIIPLLYFLANSLGKNKTIFTFPKENEMEVAVRGEKMLKVIPNIHGYGIKNVDIDINISDKKFKVNTPKICPISDGGVPTKMILGLAFIGPFFPYDRIFTYSFSWDKLITETMSKEEENKGGKVKKTSFGDLYISSRSGEVSSLYHKYTYPIIVWGVELAGRYPIDIAFNVTIEAVYPVIPIFYLKGKWFSVFSSIFRGKISDMVKGKELKYFESMDKGKDFDDKIRTFSSLFEENTGMRPSYTAYVDYQASGSQAEKDAMSAEKLATINANALKEKAKGDAFEVERLGKAEATKLRRLLEEASKHPMGAQVLIEQTRARAVEGFRGSVLSQGQQTPLQFSVGTEEKRKKEEDKK